MSGINYDLTAIRGVVFDVDGVLSPSTIPMGADGQPMRMVNIKDGYALQLAVKCGLKIAIITGGDSEAVRVRFNGLGITDVYLKASRKLEVLGKWMHRNGFNSVDVAYVGDDIPDYEAMRAVGLSVAPADADALIRRTAVYVSPVEGGYGVGRDLLEQILKAQGKWTLDERAFGW